MEDSAGFSYVAAKRSASFSAMAKRPEAMPCRTSYQVNAEASLGEPAFTISRKRFAASTPSGDAMPTSPFSFSNSTP